MLPNSELTAGSFKILYTLYPKIPPSTATSQENLGVRVYVFLLTQALVSPFPDHHLTGQVLGDVTGYKRVEK